MNANGHILVTCSRDDFLSLIGDAPYSGLVILVRRPRRALKRAALVQLIERVGNSGLQDNKPLVLRILEDEYLNQYFWQDPSEITAGRGRTGRHKALSWYVEGRWLNILEQLATRIYFLRCQLTHGAATCGSRLNRTP